MASGNKLTMTTPGDRELVMTRVFDAPRDLVFEAHTSCEHMSKWWGPRDTEFASCKMDFRPGGTWRIVLRRAGEDIPGFHGEYLEIVRPERISWTFAWEGAPGEPGPETLTLEEQDGKTTITTRSVFNSAEEREMVLRSGMVEGASETWDRLDEHLETLRHDAVR